MSIDPPPDEPLPESRPYPEPLPTEDQIPVVVPIDPIDRGDDVPVIPRRPRAQPGFWWAVLWTFGFAAILFGTLIGIVLVGAVVVAATDGPKALESDGQSVPKPLADILAMSIPIGYLAGFLFSLLALRLVAGRDWARQIGLRAPPLLHVVLVIIVLPAFVIVSDGLAGLLKQVFGSGDEASQEKMLRELFASFPWWFAVLAIGIGPGVVEELWCRGFLGRGLVGRYGWPIGILLASLFFGALHAMPVWYVLVTGVMGIGLHLVYWASRSLWVPILLHTMNNSLSTLGATGAIPLDGVERNAAAAPALVWLLGAGLLLFVSVAMATGRVRLYPIDPGQPVWQPPFPGPAHPPPGANAVARTGPVSRVAVALAFLTFLALMILLLR